MIGILTDDFDDSWVGRLVRRLQQDRDGFSAEVLSGKCDPDRYHELCARVSQTDYIMEMIPEFRRGEDQRRQPVTPVRSVEE